jgi:serine/threonine-protein kinase
MNPERLQEIQDLFVAASELPAAEQSRFLDGHCAGDPDLRRDVMALLESCAATGRFDRLAGEMSGPGAGEPQVPEVPPPSLIGPYRILDRIGHGGMGAVYLAERADGQFEQRVALKLLRADLDSEDLRQRFLAERQILAQVSHPNISGLLDGGVTSDGQPYFAMEHVDGVPIDTYCDEHRLSISRRLDLFRAVCSAVHYAHRHLIVHRDLKPANVLVTPDGVVKLLDFGIAKLLDPEALASPRPETRTGVRIMTPEYASPEQVRGDPVTTASDVYQLGVLLYELLTGHRPYRLSGRPLLEVERVVTETDPDRPSAAAARVEELTDLDRAEPITPECVSRARGTTPEKLRRQLSGDLDNIVLVALRKEPERRYGSAEQLADDVLRHQKGLPVTAQPDTILYRSSKFVRRHKIGVVTTVAGLVAVVAFAVTMGIQAERTARERDKAEQVTAFLVGIFETSDPRVTLGDTVTVREVLDRGAERIRVELADQPEIGATLMQVLGKVYHALGLVDEAAVQWEAALDLRERTLPPDHADVAQSLTDLGMLRADVGELEEAEPLLRRSVAILRSGRRRRPVELGRSLNNLGYLLQVKGEHDEAVSVYEEALEIYGREMRASEEVRSGIATLKMNLGWIEENRGDLEAAERHFRDGLVIRRELYGSTHPHIAKSLNSLAAVQLRQGKLHEAGVSVRDALALQRRLYPDGHPDIGNSLLSLANITAEQGQHSVSDSLFEASMTAHVDALGADTPQLARVKNDFAGRLRDRGEFAQAEQLYRAALPVYVEVLGEGHPFTAIVKGNLASTLYALEKRGEPERLWREAVGVLRGASIDQRFAATTMLGLATLLLDRSAYSDAEPLFRDVLEILRDNLPESQEQVVAAQNGLGVCLASQGRFEEAEQLLVDSYTKLRDVGGFEPDSVQRALGRLIGLYEDWGRPEEAERYRRMLPGDGR